MAGRPNTPGSKYGTKRRERVECEGCHGAGCSYCAGQGWIWRSRHQPFEKGNPYAAKAGNARALTYGTRITKGDPLAIIPEEYHVIVPPDVTVGEMTGYLEPLADFAEMLAEKLLTAGIVGEKGEGDDLKLADTGHEHAAVERLLLQCEEAMTAFEQGAVKPYRARSLTPEQLQEKRRQAARAASRIFTHLAFVVDKNAERDVLTTSERKGDYVAQWAWRDVPSLIRAAFSAAKNLASLAVFEAKQADERAGMLEGYAKSIGG